jgi:hypothetical protein
MATRTTHSGVTKPRPQGYSNNNPRNMGNTLNRTAYISKFWWRPTCGTLGLPQSTAAKQARLDKFFAAMTNFNEVLDSDNAFTEGRVIDNDDIEFTCLRIADAIDNLHSHGLCVPHIADPTMREAISKRQKVWRVDQEERDLTPSQREGAIAQHLEHYKKACLDAIDHDKDITILFVAAPNNAGKKRDANAVSNAKRKRTHAKAAASKKPENNEDDKQRATQSPVPILQPKLAVASSISPADSPVPHQQPITPDATAELTVDFVPTQPFTGFGDEAHSFDASGGNGMLPFNDSFGVTSGFEYYQGQSHLHDGDHITTPTGDFDVAASWVGDGVFLPRLDNWYSDTQQSHDDMMDLVNQYNEGPKES